MAILSRKEFGELAEVHQPFCVSMFIPTHQEGQDVLKQLDARMLKNQLKNVKEKLAEEGLTQLQIKQFVEPVEALIQDGSFWRHQSEGLALFLAEDFFKYYTLPLRFEESHLVSNNFHLKPLLPMLSGDGRYFILSLELDHVRFFAATRYRIEEVSVSDLVPARLEEVVGYDFEEKTVQFRSVPQGGRQGAFHGHGEGKDDRKPEIKRYLKAIDKGLNKILHNHNAPLVLFCQEHYFPMYQSVNTYKHLLPKYITGNHWQNDLDWLHEKSWELVKPLFEEDRKIQAEKYLQFQDTPQASNDIRDIIPAALGGKIEALFIRNRSELWGKYNPAKNEVLIDEDYRPPSVSLLDLAAIQTIQNRGDAYLMEKEEMPDPASAVCALYRY